MKAFLRDNPTLAFGLGLPLLLVAGFLLVSGIPNLLVAAPQYDVLYTTGYYSHRDDVHISVVDSKVQVLQLGAPARSQRARLWRYNAASGSVKEIPILFSPVAKRSPDRANSQVVREPITIQVPELAGMTVDSSSIAPDGYEFASGGDRYSRNVFGGLFYSSRYYNDAVLIKKGRSIRLPTAHDRYYGRNTQFVGWVVAQ